MSQSNSISVATLVKDLQLSNETVTLFQNRSDLWEQFGKTNSHLLRAKLFRLFNNAKLNGEQIVWIFTLFAVIKNLNRVKNHLDNLPPEIKSHQNMGVVKNFMDNNLVQYTNQETNDKFAVVHLPTTMPGLDILLTAMLYEKSEMNLDMITGKQTFSQLNLSTEVQGINKVKQMDFWNNIVKKTKNINNKEKDFKFHEEFYENSVSDKYNLFDHNLKEVAPTNPTVGYTMEEIKNWYDKVKIGFGKMKAVTSS
jgi:hypothetical protein